MSYPYSHGSSSDIFFLPLLGKGMEETFHWHFCEVVLAYPSRSRFKGLSDFGVSLSILEGILWNCLTSSTLPSQNHQHWTPAVLTEFCVLFCEISQRHKCFTRLSSNICPKGQSKVSLVYQVHLEWKQELSSLPFSKAFHNFLFRKSPSLLSSLVYLHY